MGSIVFKLYDACIAEDEKKIATYTEEMKMLPDSELKMYKEMFRDILQKVNMRKETPETSRTKKLVKRVCTILEAEGNRRNELSYRAEGDKSEKTDFD